MTFDHAFCIPAYGNSPWLSDCIASLKRQQAGSSRIVVITSTPSGELSRVTQDAGVPLIETGQRPGIDSDWNFALTATDARFVTIAHQDDVYAPDFSVRTRDAFLRHQNALLVMTGYAEHTPAGKRPPNRNMRVKSILSEWAFLGREAIASRSARRRLLCLGNPVCCPSVTFDRARIPDFRFNGGYRTNLDWDAWIRLADEPGSFVYLREPLVSKGIHADSETTATIASSAREAEDRQLFERFWPGPVVAALMKIYRKSYAANRV